MNDDFMQKIMGIVGEQRAAAYKEGFTDGVNFIKQSFSKESTKLEDFWEEEDL